MRDIKEIAPIKHDPFPSLVSRRFMLSVFGAAAGGYLLTAADLLCSQLNGYEKVIHTPLFSELRLLQNLLRLPPFSHPDQVQFFWTRQLPKTGTEYLYSSAVAQPGNSYSTPIDYFSTEIKNRKPPRTQTTLAMVPFYFNYLIHLQQNRELQPELQSLLLAFNLAEAECSLKLDAFIQPIFQEFVDKIQTLFARKFPATAQPQLTFHFIPTSVTIFFASPIRVEVELPRPPQGVFNGAFFSMVVTKNQDFDSMSFDPAVSQQFLAQMDFTQLELISINIWWQFFKEAVVRELRFITLLPVQYYFNSKIQDRT